MSYLGTVDYVVIVIYFAFIVGLGLYLTKRASASMEDYFLGGRQLPWWALGISGMASFLDITGTMLIVGYLFMVGPKGLFVEFRGGAVLVLVVMMLWSGKWHRRSGCITEAEWMIYRFGDTPGGKFARAAKALAGILFVVSLIAYLSKGVGIFLATFLPFSPLTCSLVMVGIATIYTLSSGFYGVVFTDIIQSVIILGAVIGITWMALGKIESVEQISAIAHEVTGQDGWANSAWSWKVNFPKGYDEHNFLFIISLFYLARNIFFGMGAGGEPKYFGAKSDAECGKLTFFWTWLMMFRWPMMMAFAVLGLFLVKDFFPDFQVLADASSLIKAHFPNVEESRWGDILASIINSPQNQPVELIEGIKAILGEDSWQAKLQLVSFHGTIFPDRVLPAVILHNIPAGFRGLILVALIAASMSTFDSNLNMTIGLYTRDIYQAYINPQATNKQLMKVNWYFGIAVVVLGFLFGYTVKSINDIWGWFIMALGGGLMVPSILRFYWSRFNGGGFAIGTLVGIIGAVSMRLLQDYYVPGLEEGHILGTLLSHPASQFVLAVLIGLIGSVVGTFITEPTSKEVLEYFYKTTRPFGFWKGFDKLLTPEQAAAMKKEHKRDVLTLPFATAWQITLFLLPMQMVIKGFDKYFYITLAIFLVSLFVLVFYWLRHIHDNDGLFEDAVKSQQN